MEAIVSFSWTRATSPLITRPCFVVFRFQKTEICLSDLQYGVPFLVRDTAPVFDSIDMTDADWEFIAEEHERCG
ncbi:hypothetical protein ABKV19_014906 [Rosa sericea]